MYKHQETTEKIIKAFYNVYNGLGYGFLEKGYENAMMIEFKAQIARKVYDNERKGTMNWIKSTMFFLFNIL